MRKLLALLLCAVLTAGCLTGCVIEADQTHVPTYDDGTLTASLAPGNPVGPEPVRLAGGAVCADFDMLHSRPTEEAGIDLF